MRGISKIQAAAIITKAEDPVINIEIIGPESNIDLTPDQARAYGRDIIAKADGITRRYNEIESVE